MKSESKPLCGISSYGYSNYSLSNQCKTVLNRNKPKLLLHACCGPCATACIERVAFDYSVTVLYYNPNITDGEEYSLRRENLLKFINAFNEEHKDKTFVDLLDEQYNPEYYLKKTERLKNEPEGGKRCDVCFDIRLRESARQAKLLDMDLFTTTLSVSPYKNYEKIQKLGYILEDEYEVKFLDIDFKKNDGYKRSIELSKKYGLYRQKFCGCEYARNAQKRVKRGKENDKTN